MVPVEYSFLKNYVGNPRRSGLWWGSANQHDFVQTFSAARLSDSANQTLDLCLTNQFPLGASNHRVSIENHRRFDIHTSTYIYIYKFVFVLTLLELDFQFLY